MIDSEFNSTLTHPTEYFFHVKIIDFPTSLGLDNRSELFFPKPWPMFYSYCKWEYQYTTSLASSRLFMFVSYTNIKMKKVHFLAQIRVLTRR